MPPPMRPLQLAELSVTECQDVILDVKRRLNSVRRVEAARQACAEHFKLRLAVAERRDAGIGVTKRVRESNSDVEEYWAPVGVEYNMLRTVAGGFATIFPGSSPTESDFSILRQEKSQQHSRLADLTAEGMFHTRQWGEVEDLQALEAKVL